MKAVVSGDIKSLRASELKELEKLATKRSSARDLVDVDLASRVSVLVEKLGVHIGLIIARDGRITHVVVGSKNRLFLPDLGRFRLDKARLRRLRLIVFVPEGERILEPSTAIPTVYGRKDLDEARKTRASGPRAKTFDSPRISQDLLTDLDKLRLDILLVIAVTAGGIAGPVSVAHLDILSDSSRADNRSRRLGERGMRFLHALSIRELDFAFDNFIADLENRFAEQDEGGYDTEKDKAILVGAYTGTDRQAKASMNELRELANTAGVTVADSIIQRRRSLDPKTLVGKGKIEDLVLLSLDLGAELLIFDGELSPGQLRSITKLTELRVIDRSMLILDIFAQRAVTSDGRLQVELAQLKYSLPRLTEKDSGLSRLTGGIGGRGPGETKLEISRRRIRDRISDLEKRIDALARQRGLRRERRQEKGVPVIAIVGYTNAGKSTLLNALTKANVLVESKLFATLDPSSKRMRFPNEREVVFVDTVGFIRELPDELVAAFRATLEEVAEADVLVHLVDATDEDLLERIKIVRSTLASLGMESKPCLLVLNKVDCLSRIELDTLINSTHGLPISALKRDGFDVLINRIEEAFVALCRYKTLNDSPMVN
ncbi:MAG: GTPase HflX [Deltaproteobacteria bacterium]|nr:GTPase HflX [Deltaproteobacteria bacterium]